MAAVPANFRDRGHPALVEGETPSLPGKHAPLWELGGQI